MAKLVRVADVIIEFLYDIGINSVFTVTGGGAMFLNDAVAYHPKMKVVCNHHEQACAMGAVGYSKFRNSFSAAILTTGCGATNAITGLLDAWQDNTPCFFVSGQVKKKETGRNAKVPLRQFGVQEADIVAIVDSITKYSIMINDPNDILYVLEKAKYYAESGRPGPVWIDVPMDVQGAFVDKNRLRHFIPSSRDFKKPKIKLRDISLLEKNISKAKRPIVIAGNGIRLGNATDLFRKFIEKTKIPFVVSYLASDILPSDHSQYIGRLGVKGDRAGNFSLQNSDLIISIGCHLSVALTGFEYQLFGREAKLVVIDIDAEEHKKNTVKIDHFIHADVVDFFKIFKAYKSKDSWMAWNATCINWRDKWPVCLPSYLKSGKNINKYAFIEILHKHLKINSVVVSDAGSSYYVTSQAFKALYKQRYITSGAQADMGFTLPASIGVASAANDGEIVIGITGDGSFQMNIQELQTIAHHQLPIKIVVLNNNGYLSIRATQKKFFAGREIGTDNKSGISFPSVEKIAKAYGIKFFKENKLKNLDKTLSEVMNNKEPVILEIICPSNQEIIPTASSKKLDDGRMISKPLEDMYPFMDREEFLSNMIILPIDED